MRNATSEKLSEKVKEILDIPLPSLYKLQQTFNFFSLKPGIFKPMLTYIEHHLSQKEEWKNGPGKHCGLCFDEMSLSKVGMYDEKFDVIIGKNSFGSIGFSRSILQSSL